MVVATKFNVKHQGKDIHHPPSTIYKLPLSDLPESTLCPSLSLSFTILVVAKCNIFPLLYPGYQSILCPDRKCLTYLCVESSQQSAYSPAPRAHAAAAPRKVTSALPSLAPRWAGGRGAEGQRHP